MQATRQEILDHLRAKGRATVKELGEALGLTPTGIRQHLTVLERENFIEAREERGHVGRPALVYRLTGRGDELYPKKYDLLANTLIEEARSAMGTDALQHLMKNVAARFAEPYASRMAGKDIGERVEEATRIIAERGSLVRSERDGDDYLISQCSCPFPNVATKNSAVCAMEVEFVRRLVGADARLTTSLLRGDSSCTYRIRAGVKRQGGAKP